MADYTQPPRPFIPSGLCDFLARDDVAQYMAALIAQSVHAPSAVPPMTRPHTNPTTQLLLDCAELVRAEPADAADLAMAIVFDRAAMRWSYGGRDPLTEAVVALATVCRGLAAEASDAR